MNSLKLLRTKTVIPIMIKYTTSLLLLLIGCVDLGDPPPAQDEVPKVGKLKALGLSSTIAVRMAYVAPYLYVAGGSSGVWRRNIPSEIPWEYLGLADTALGQYSNVGVVDIAPSPASLLVAYNESRAQIPPDSMIAVWRSTDFGTSWARSDSGIPQSRRYAEEPNAVNALARSPFEPNTVIAVYGPAIYRSTDDGAHWAFRGTRGVFVNRDRIRWQPNNPNTAWIYGETSLFEAYLYRSTDFGISFYPSLDFVALGFPSDNAVADIGFTPSNPNIIIVTTNHGLAKSTDAGNNWTRIQSAFPSNGFISSMIEDPRRPQGLLLAGGSNIYYSSNGAERVVTIAQIPDGLVESLCLDTESGFLFIGTTRGVYVLPVGY